MKLVTLLAFLSACVAFSSAGRVVCYLVRWAINRKGDGKFQASNIDPNLCTHIIYYAFSLDTDLSIYVPDDWESTSLTEINTILSFKEDNPDLKLLVTVGGPGKEFEDVPPISADPVLRATLIANILDFLETYGFDGVEIYWDYLPPQNDPTGFIALLNDLRDALSSRDYILAVYAISIYSMMQDIYPDRKAITDVVDFLNIRTLDYHGGWGDDPIVGHYAPLYPAQIDTDLYLNVNATVQYWLTAGADKSKINLGLGSFGRPFTLVDPELNTIGSPASGDGEDGPLTQETGMWGYNEICSVFADYERIWDQEQQVPHKVSGDQWVGYDDEESILVKVRYANDLGLGGVSLYSLDTEDFLGACGNETFPLLRVINANLE